MVHNTPHSEESKQKMSEAHKKEMANPEIRKKVSNSVKKLWANPEYRARMIEAFKGHPSKRKGIPLTEEHKRKLREARQKVIANLLFRIKMSLAHKGQKAWNKGIPPSKEQIEKQKASYKATLFAHPEIKLKMGLAKKGKPSWNKGIPMREETRRKLSLAEKGHHNSLRTQFKKGNITWNTGRTGVYTPEQLKRMSEAQKGKPAWNKGIPPSKEQIEKQRASIKKITSNPEYRRRMSENFRKAWANPELRKKQSEKIKQFFSNPEARKKLSELLKGHVPWNKGIKGLQVAWNKGLMGEKSTSWKGGLSFEPYSPEWTDVLKNLIRERDNYTCQICFKKGYPVHHIDYNKKKM